MKSFCLVLAFAAAACAVSFEDDLEWIGFKTRFSKSYETKKVEMLRRKIFHENLEFITNTNEAKRGYTLVMNEFGDLSNDEFAERFGKFDPSVRVRGQKYQRPPAAFMFPQNENSKNLPEAVDWRTRGFVTPVKNQGSCGSCWAFSTTGSLEGQHFRKTGKLVSLSEQNLVDCSLVEGDHGCGGGLMDFAFTYVAINGGINSEADYPYKAVQGNCAFNQRRVVATDVSYVNIPKFNETALKMAVATVGPISVAIDASAPEFRFYHSGVMRSSQCSQYNLDHGVLAVGYGTENGQDYWLVKNSWGANWGAEGYIKMSRNNNNNCGIATSASYPIV